MALAKAARGQIAQVPTDRVFRNVELARQIDERRTVEQFFADATLNAIQHADPSPTNDKPYYGLQFAAIPEFQGLGTAVGQQMAAALSGSTTVEQALSQAQAIATREMTRGGYIKN